MFRSSGSSRKKRTRISKFPLLPQEHRHSDRRLRRFGEEIEAQIDCTQCANCCRVTEVGITERDIEKLAKFLGVTAEEFHRAISRSSTTPAI